MVMLSPHLTFSSVSDASSSGEAVNLQTRLRSLSSEIVTLRYGRRQDGQAQKKWHFQKHFVN